MKRVFARNDQASGTFPSGTTGTGRVLVLESGQSPLPGYEWVDGPDETDHWIIARDAGFSTRTRRLSPSPEVGVCFWRAGLKSSGETDFVNFANSVFPGIGFYSGIQVKAWLESNGYWTNFSSIVTSGLVFNLDAQGETPGGGFWTDSAGGNDVTLYNSPVLTTSAPYYFTFDPANLQYGRSFDVIGDLSNWTVECWFRMTAPNLNGIVSSLVTDEYLNSKLNFSLGTNNAPINYNLTAGFYNAGWRSAGGFAPSPSTWYQAVGTYDGSAVSFYQNSSLWANQYTTSLPSQAGGRIRIARRWDESPTNSTNFFPADIAIVRIYNFALDYSMIVENFNAVRGRFGI